MRELPAETVRQENLLRSFQIKIDALPRHARDYEHKEIPRKGADIYLRLVVSGWIANAFGDVARAVPAAVVILGGIRDKVCHLARLRRGHAVGKALDLGWRRRWGWRRRRW